jgi:hypothetical protein
MNFMTVNDGPTNSQEKYARLIEPRPVAEQCAFEAFGSGGMFDGWLCPVQDDFHDAMDPVIANFNLSDVQDHDA